MTWRRALAWLIVVIILAGPVVRWWVRRRDAVGTAQEARQRELLTQQVALLRQQVELSAAQLTVWADTWGERADVVKARLRALRDPGGKAKP